MNGFIGGEDKKQLEQVVKSFLHNQSAAPYKNTISFRAKSFAKKRNFALNEVF